MFHASTGSTDNSKEQCCLLLMYRTSASLLCFLRMHPSTFVGVRTRERELQESSSEKNFTSSKLMRRTGYITVLPSVPISKRVHQPPCFRCLSRRQQGLQRRNSVRLQPFYVVARLVQPVHSQGETTVLRTLKDRCNANQYVFTCLDSSCRASTKFGI
jgi:hypothetical protein